MTRNAFFACGVCISLCGVLSAGAQVGRGAQGRAAQRPNQDVSRVAASLKPGDVAPDFELPLLDTNTMATGVMPEKPQTVRLSSLLAGKRPVVLIFSSFT